MFCIGMIDPINIRISPRSLPKIVLCKGSIPEQHLITATPFFLLCFFTNTPIHSFMADVLQVRGLHFIDLLSPLLLCLSSGCPSGLSAMPSLEGIVLVVQPVAVRPGDHSGCDICQLHLSTFQGYIAALECRLQKASQRPSPHLWGQEGCLEAWHIRDKPFWICQRWPLLPVDVELVQSAISFRHS